MFDELKNNCEEITEQMGQRLFRSVAEGRMPTFADLMTEDSQVRLKRDRFADDPKFFF